MIFLHSGRGYRYKLINEELQQIMIPVSQPDIGIAELVEIADTLESGWIGLGSKTKEFEDAFREQYGYEHSIGTNSCTAALDLAVKSLNLDGTEILVPPVTWISTAHVGVYNDYDIGWVDVRSNTLNMDPTALEERISEKTAAVIPVHYGGQPVEIDRIVGIAHEHNAKVIEDSAHAPGATYNDEYVGTFGDVGCFSFQATKPLTTGEGGAFVTDNDEVADRARRLSKLGVDKSTHARSEEDGYDWYYDVTHTGYKYFMHDISAAMGLVQLDRQPELRTRRNQIAEEYAAGFENLDWVTPLTTKEGITHSRYNYTILVPADDRDQLVDHLIDNDIGASVHYMPLYKHPVFEDHDPDLPVTESVWKKIVTIPMSPVMTDRDVDRVINTTRSYWI